MRQQQVDRQVRPQAVAYVGKEEIREIQRAGNPSRHRVSGVGAQGLTRYYALLSRRSAREGLRGTIVGSTLSCTVSLVTTTLATSSRLGMSYITGSRTSSMIARRPRAPVPRWIAWSAMASSASWENSSSTLSISNSRVYRLTKAFFGLDRICTKDSLSRF